MKSLTKYIKESFEEFKIKDLVVKYKCFPDEEYIQFYLPESYSEDDFIIYLGDKYFNKLPGSDKFAEDYYGSNERNIYDVYFEFERYEKGVESKGDFIDWDKDIDKKHNPEDEEFVFVQVKGLNYVLSFDEFAMKDEDSSNINETITKIFAAANANDNNKFPLEITFDEKNIEYKE